MILSVVSRSRWVDHQDPLKAYRVHKVNYFHNANKTFSSLHCVDVCFDGIKANIGKN